MAETATKAAEELAAAAAKGAAVVTHAQEGLAGGVVAATGGVSSGGEQHTGAKSAAEAAEKKRMPPEFVEYFLSWERMPVPRIASRKESCDFVDEMNEEIAKYVDGLKTEYSEKGFIEVGDDYDLDDIDAMSKESHRDAYLKVYGTLPPPSP